MATLVGAGRLMSRNFGVSGFRMPKSGLVASFEAGKHITKAGGLISNWGDLSGNAHDLLQATGANQPIHLPFTRQRYVYHPGVAGNYLSTPNAAANQITAEISLIWHGSLDSLTPAAFNIFIDKWDSVAGNYGYWFGLSPTGILTFQISPDGTAATNYPATVSLATAGVTADTDIFLKVNRLSTTGNTFFYWSSDGSNWTQIGTTVGGSISGIFASTRPVGVGARVAGTGAFPLGGKTYYAEIWNGIAGSGGTLAQRLDANDGIDGDTSIVSSTTGETWTVNQVLPGAPCYLVGKAGVLFDGSAHWMNSVIAGLGQPTEVFFVGQQLVWQPTVLHDGASVSSTLQLYQVTATPQVSIAASLALGASVSPPVKTDVLLSEAFNGASSQLQLNAGTPVTGNVGTGSSGGVSLGSNGAHTVFGNIIARELHLYNATLSVAQRAYIVAGLMSRNGL